MLPVLRNLNCERHYLNNYLLLFQCLELWLLSRRGRRKQLRLGENEWFFFFAQPKGPGKESGGQDRWRRNPGIQFDLPQLSPRICSSPYFSKVRSSFRVLSRAKIQRTLEQRYANKFCAKLGKSGSETLQLLRTAYRDAVLPSAQSSDGIRRSRTEGRALRTNGAQGLQLQELRTMWLVWRLFWIGTVVWVCG